MHGFELTSRDSGTKQIDEMNHIRTDFGELRGFKIPESEASD